MHEPPIAPCFIMTNLAQTELHFREGVRPSDGAAVRNLATATGFFRPDETAVAVELVEERLRDGEKCSYRFLFAELEGGQLVGYTCYGAIPCTIGSFDLYWIIVDPAHQKAGIGRQLMERTEAFVAASGGRQIFIETSSTSRYEPTRSFYRRCGYEQVAELADFYLPGDHKVIFARSVDRPQPRGS
jgi:ribosomal protein S18 acetylase RimI-like enzyme